MERQDGGGGGGNASRHLVCTRTTPTLYSTYTVAVRVSLHPACTHTSPTTRPGCRGSWRPCGLSFRGVGSRGVARRASSTHRASTRDTNVHRATYRRAIETGFVFADSRGHVRAGQRATRAAGRGRWICERFAKSITVRLLPAKSITVMLLDLDD